ncbi:thioesterase family protein [Nocardioides mangrovi]|uniref:Thioesterase family protein n=1 Tax=Nocardioides mangrovi TaxID=2874580 RepID=A0ABS7UBR4_9ACTN|nr:thioesterase family protein [Nocardioides mangrovi]MBZ5738416.1 thioesterase family protein [Nocardioides mangrovi]
MPPTTQQPTYDEVLAVPAVLEGTVAPEFIDDNGHMNVRHYLDYGAHGADRICRDVGIDRDYRANRRMGVFTAEHHIRYFSEMHEGDPFSVHTLFLERSSRAGHVISLILDRRREVLSCTVEIALVHVDLDSRRALPYPDDVAAGIDAWVAQAAAVPWPMPLSGAMGLRR